ncbi:MAG: amidase family protein [Vicinamibacterales bacterium]|jgi:amidase|nr:glutamyl-tRNA amidotransferase [Acidobacteriota bacterium]MDP7294083.1 amidase family protein [Vicinamibacterales bacterium]MDP7470960.1 amidase family protein [Vicinamibacterales bacterium]MDP7672643.1 amidase family protein [Vicinamibacterales bacterium]HJO37298.1 amidase family protein [Vicinamibacterales bacterium]
MQPPPHGYRRLATLIFLLFLSGAAGTGFAQPVDVTTATLEEINRAFDAGTLTAEHLVSLYLARIAAFDKVGPTLNAVITLNPDALGRARALDAERRSQGPRSRLHGVPVVLKDNLDTADMPTTAGSSLLRGSLPPDDAFIVRKLREAGAIVLAKLNMSEFASGGAQSSLGGPMRNPHDLGRSPAGSSGGTGIAVAAAYAQFGLGTDTGGSVRMPSTANGIVGLKPTHGLMSRDGIIPLALTFDMAGPMARHVYDVAVALGVMAGVDPADDSTRKSEGQARTDYAQYLDAGALGGARLGIARDFLGQDADVDWIVEASLAAMRDAGTTVVDVRLPDWLLDANNALYTTIRHREFRAQIPEYLATLTAGYPETLAALVERATRLTAPIDGALPNPGRWRLMEREDDSGELSDHEYEAVYTYGLPLIRTIVQGVLDANDLDALVYPTQPRRPTRLDADPAPTASGGPRRPSPIRFANLTGFPDLVVPAGFTGNRLPVGVSFLGRPFSEPRLLALGYAFEQITQARRLPVHTPALSADADSPQP